MGNKRTTRRRSSKKIPGLPAFSAIIGRRRRKLSPERIPAGRRQKFFINLLLQTGGKRREVDQINRYHQFVTRSLAQAPRFVTARAKRALLTLCVLLLTAGLAPPAQADEALPRVVPGGQSIGIVLPTEGATIVGFSPIVTAGGQSEEPAAAAGLQIGDFITAINGNAVASNSEIAAEIEAAGREHRDCVLEYLHEGQKNSVTVTPRFCADSRTWRIGLYVRDSTAGVGTLTYYDPATGGYGALGHEVSDLQYGVSTADKGCVIRAVVQSVRAGRCGSPGEKLGVFRNDGWQGSILLNCRCGIFGYFPTAPPVSMTETAVPVARAAEVVCGPAEIYTVIDGEAVESFTVNIVKTMTNSQASGRGLIVEITDPALLAATGGIVQGMSGSPILQNGKLVGAVTHVFVNDPTLGYGCFAEWMLEEAAALTP